MSPSFPASWRAPRVVRAHASITIVALDDQGPRVALVANESTAAAAGTLDRIAAAHERAAGPHVAAPVARGVLASGAPYLLLACDAVADLEPLIAALARSRTKSPYAAAAAFNEVLLDVLERAERVGVAPLGAIGWGNVLVGPTGNAWLFGLGDNFPVRDGRGALAGHGGIVEAPEVGLGMPATHASDVYVVHVLARGLVPYVDIPPSFIGALEGDDGVLREALLALSADCTSPDPLARPRDIASLRARYSHFRTIDPRIPGPDAAAFARVTVRALASVGPPARLRLDATRRTATLDGTVIDLSRRRGPWRLLHALALGRRADRDTPMSVDALVRAGWPEESLVADSGRARVYVALHALRKLGLRDAVERRDDGWLLTIDAAIDDETTSDVTPTAI